jgi:DNA-binding transcriptional MerR regulator
MKGKYSIKAASALSGLSPLTIRTWENRYGIVSPERSKGNHRLYSDGDIERLRLLSEAVDRGFRIGNVASLDDDEIQSLLNRKPEEEEDSPLEYCLRMVQEMKTDSLEDFFERSALKDGVVQTMDDLILPLMVRLGDMWHRGEIPVYKEHLTTETVRRFMAGRLTALQRDEGTPLAVAASPAGQFHDLGALASAVCAEEAGFRVLYMGADSPAEGLVRILEESGATVLILSIVFPAHPSKVRNALEMIRRCKPEGIRLFLGGSSAAAYALPGEMPLRSDLRALKEELDRILGMLRT